MPSVKVLERVSRSFLDETTSQCKWHNINKQYSQQQCNIKDFKNQTVSKVTNFEREKSPNFEKENLKTSTLNKKLKCRLF